MSTSRMREATYSLTRCLPLLVPLFLLTACEPPQGKSVKLPSGREIKIVSVGRMYFSNDDPALMLKYRTTISLDDLPALEAEAEEAWGVFRADVEKAGFTIGIVSANEQPQGLIVYGNRMFNFVYRKSPTSGEWSKVSRPKR